MCDILLLNLNERSIKIMIKQRNMLDEILIEMKKDVFGDEDVELPENILEDLPENATLEEQVEDIYLRLCALRGLKDYEEGKYKELTIEEFEAEIYEMLENYERKLDKAAESTALPDNPDMNRVECFVERINRYAVTGELV